MFHRESDKKRHKLLSVLMKGQSQCVNKEERVSAVIVGNGYEQRRPLVISSCVCGPES